MNNQILLIAGIGIALFLMSSQSVLEKTGTDKIIKEKRPSLPVEMPVFSKQAVPLEQKNHLGDTPYILPSPLSNLGRNTNMRSMSFY